MSRYPPPGMVGPLLIAAWALRTQAEQVQVHGVEHVPREGPVLLVARHYHHLLDGAVIVRAVRRPVHVVVALDWAAGAAQRRWMERACRWARWPVILRPETTGSRGAFDRSEVGRYLRSGLREAAELLRDGRVVAVFPEGYPVVEPGGAASAPRPRDADGFLPFAAGFRTIASLARSRGAQALAIVPLGFRYERRGTRWGITARFGPPLGDASDVGAVAEAVRMLSAPASPERPGLVGTFG